ncbi:MAG: M23 family metallopeptidase [Clostridia bacterium]|nr:M23 family metallopeptidase [Clostridia bacterium]
MRMDKETKEQVKKYFTSKKFITAVVIVMLAAGTGVGTVVSVKKQLREQLQPFEETLKQSVTEKVTEEAANDLTGITVENTEPESETETVTQNEDAYIFPAGSEIVKDFSDFVAVKSKTMNDWRVHNGVDFKAEEGSDVKSMYSGIVTSIHNSSLWGTVIEIDHGKGVIARYCGLKEECNVAVNDVVEKGQIIGQVGVLPVEKDDGPHLHLEAAQDGLISDPLQLLVAQQ